MEEKSRKPEMDQFGKGGAGTDHPLNSFNPLFAPTSSPVCYCLTP